MSQHPDRITVYSDYVCPFCYLGKRSLETYLAQRDENLDIDWHPFDLRRGKRGPDGEIDHTVDDGKDEAYFARARQNVERLRNQYDVEEMRNLDEIPDDVDSVDAQVASLYVKTDRPDLWAAFDDAIFEALWVDGRDIGDVEVLTELARDVGLEGDEIRAAIADEDLRERLEKAFADAERTGVTGVPTFVYDEYAAQGAVPSEQLRRLVEGY